MKVINQICRILAFVLGICAVVLFFFPFVSLPVSSSAVDVSGIQLAIGSKINVSKVDYHLARSLYLLLTFVFAVFSTIFAGVGLFSKKGKGARVTSFISAIIAGVLMLVIALSKVKKFVDYRPLVLDLNAKLAYAPIVLILAIVLFACAIIGIIGWVVNDYIEVLASNGQKLTIWQKIKKFFRENVAEIRKIVWPGPKAIVKNSVIVLILCAILGAFIWIIDYPLGLLVDYIAKL